MLDYEMLSKQMSKIYLQAMSCAPSTLTLEVPWQRHRRHGVPLPTAFKEILVGRMTRWIAQNLFAVNDRKTKSVAHTALQNFTMLPQGKAVYGMPRGYEGGLDAWISIPKHSNDPGHHHITRARMLIEAIDGIDLNTTWSNHNLAWACIKILRASQEVLPFTVATGMGPREASSYGSLAGTTKLLRMDNSPKCKW